MAHVGAQEVLETLVDSGSDGDLISQEVVRRLKIPVDPLSPVLLIHKLVRHP